jgi:hypothetical protein
MTHILQLNTSKNSQVIFLLAQNNETIGIIYQYHTDFLSTNYARSKYQN